MIWWWYSTSKLDLVDLVYGQDFLWICLWFACLLWFSGFVMDWKTENQQKKMSTQSWKSGQLKDGKEIKRTIVLSCTSTLLRQQLRV